MKTAALFSGGKDSAFALYLAMQMGHDVRFLINIVPKKDSSWIFHTPNVDIVPAMAESIGIPLITAKTDGTEEDDIRALRDALNGLDIEGVIVGALWSDYQWDRMNKVFGDLNLVMIAPLWRKEQSMAYDEMVSSGTEAVIVGVFAEGLDEKWLGRKLDMDAKKELVALHDTYGISIMGEGGEYESMTIDSPIFRKKIKIVSSKNECKKDSGMMDVTEVVLESK